MKQIEFKTEEEFLNNTYFYDKGQEAQLYRYVIDGRELLIKKYYNQNDLNLEKIELVSALKTDGLIKPEYLVKIGNNVESFAMEFKRGCYPLSRMKSELSTTQKYLLLLRLKEIIFELLEENCYYDDLHPNNIITNGKNIYLCDPINIKLKNYDFIKNNSTINYTEIEKLKKSNLLYRLNLITIYILNNINMEEIETTVINTLTNIFNKKDYKQIIGVTDSMDTLNASYDIFTSSEPCTKLLLDYIEFTKVEDIKRTK